MKKLIAIFLSIVLILAATAAFADTKITVNGTGEVRVSADTAVISLGVNTRDKDVLKAQQKVNETIATIRAALFDAGVKKKTSTRISSTSTPSTIIRKIRNRLSPTTQIPRWQSKSRIWRVSEALLTFASPPGRTR